MDFERENGLIGGEAVQSADGSWKPDMRLAWVSEDVQHPIKER
jgi:hypothetical protein